MLNVLCFNCGGMFQVEEGTPNLTKQCPKCKIKQFENQVDFE